jgi:radical SAM superfamily enzyme YgiQ (UPF0313 family)
MLSLFSCATDLPEGQEVVAIKDHVFLVNSLGSVETNCPEHLGLGYIASVLRQNKFHVKVIDANFFNLEPTSVYELLRREKSLMVGFSTYMTNVYTTLKTIRLLRKGKNRAHITLGGHFATFRHEELLSKIPEVDSIVLGEGEETALELVRSLSEHTEWRQLPGLTYRNENGKIARSQPRRLISDLDGLPFPYRVPYVKSIKKRKWVAICSSRGCFARCSFCSVPSFYAVGVGARWRGRSASNIVDEIEEVIRAYGVVFINFIDDEFVGPGKLGTDRAYALGEELLKRKTKVRFRFQCRADVVDGELFAFLKKSGLSLVSIGVESFSDRQLIRFRKDITAKQNKDSILKLKRIGLPIEFYLIPFDPFVSLDDLQKNINAMKELGIRPSPMIFQNLIVDDGMSILESLRKENMMRRADLLAHRNEISQYSYKFANDHVQEIYEVTQRVKKDLSRLIEDVSVPNTKKTTEIYVEIRKKIGEKTLDLFEKTINWITECNCNRTDVGKAIDQELVEFCDGVHKMLQASDGDEWATEKR